MGGSEKQKKLTPVGRPVSTQSTSVAECMIKNIPIDSEAGNQVKEAQCSISSGVSVSEEVIEVTEGVNEASNVAIISSNLSENETVAVVSAEKRSISLEVGASLIRLIRGKEWARRKKIEEEMGVKIILPWSSKEDCITIEGISDENVTRASEKIETIIDEAVRSPSFDYSHFVSLPLAIHPELVEKLVNFQDSILGNSHVVGDDAGDDQDEDSSRNEIDQPLYKESGVAVKLKASNETNQVDVDMKRMPLVSFQHKAKGKKPATLFDLGIEKSIFIKPRTFHLTVLMLKLWNKDRVNAACDVLKSISSSVMDALDNRPVSIRLKGLDCMKGSLAKARVLYAPVEEVGNEGRLLRACQVIIDAFVKAGLVLERDAKHSLKLHATVMNVRHRKGKERTKTFDSFDAREIHKQFGEEEWGEYLIREAHLSQRFAFDESGYYHCCTSMPFPQNEQVERNVEVD